jgi:hypothetical protein
MRRLAGIVLVLTAAALAVPAAWAAVGRPQEEGSPIHPVFPLLDASGANVLESGQPVSTLETCGACHDADFISEHNTHARAGLGNLTSPGSTSSGRAWDISEGLFGRWDPLDYRLLSLPGDSLLDLGTADWIRTYGARHVGGGPSSSSRSGVPLTEVAVRAGDPETHVLDAGTGRAVTWDWVESGTVEPQLFPVPLAFAEQRGADGGVARRAIRLGEHGHAAGHRDYRADG